MIKTLLQKLIRFINISLFTKSLPLKVSIYFHETYKNDIEDIERIILFFKKEGYEFVTIDNFNRHLDDSSKHFAFTFDDGFANWVDTLEVFKKYNVKSTFFMNSIQFTDESKVKFLSDINCPDEDFLIDEKGLEKIINAGHEIGAHTHSHRTLKRLTEEEFNIEINKNIEILKSLGIRPLNFAIPFGMRRYINQSQLDYLNSIFNSVSYGEPGMLYNHIPGKIQRYPWRTQKSFKFNIQNISANTILFNNLTKRSGLG
jgi:peptidoglycan/xylan/chitin deacetylase (PgdA/CDA1 family)